MYYFIQKKILIQCKQIVLKVPLLSIRVKMYVTI